MKIMKIIVLTLLILLSVKLDAQTMSASHSTIPLSEPGKPYSLTIELGAANINLSYYTGKDIVIDMIKKVPKNTGRSDESDNRRLVLSNGNTNLNTKESNNLVTITNASSAREMIDLNIKIPARATSIKLKVNSGIVTASNISGDIEATNTHGNLTLNNISGSAVANTNDGDLTVTFKSLDPKAALAFSSLRGNISVTLPAAFKANVKLRSDQGFIYSDFDIATENKGVKIGDNESYRWRIDDWVNGKIGGGGQELMIKNYRGHIYLRKPN